MGEQKQPVGVRRLNMPVSEARLLQKGARSLARSFRSVLRCGLLAGLAVLAAVPRASAQTAVQDAALAADLEKKDVVLLRAVHTADRQAWRDLAASDFFYLDEEGGVTPLPEFLRDLAPMSTKPLTIQTYGIKRIGDTTIVRHEDTDESNVRYVFSETWQKLAGRWKIRSLTITNKLSDPPAVSLSTGQIDEFVGTYRHGPTLRSLRREGSRIVSQQEGGSPIEWKAETRDTLFTPGRPRVRIVLQRDGEARVTGFVVRYVTSDTLWTKLP